jgi:hypothetical protein
MAAAHHQHVEGSGLDFLGLAGARAYGHTKDDRSGDDRLVTIEYDRPHS